VRSGCAGGEGFRGGLVWSGGARRKDEG
jgi:hypothetical protein